MGDLPISQQGIIFQSPSLLKELLTPVTISYPDVIEELPITAENQIILPSQKFMGLWDTGATGTCVTQKVVDALQLSPTGKIKVIHAGGEETVNTYYLNLSFPNGLVFQMVNVSLMHDDGKVDVLIGMDIISQGDLLLCNANGKTRFEFFSPALSQLSFKPSSLYPSLLNTPEATTGSIPAITKTVNWSPTITESGKLPVSRSLPPEGSDECGCMG